LLKPGEEHGDQRRRATDLIWSKETYRLDKIFEDPKNRTLYYITGDERPFVREELVLIPEDTKAPPEYVQEW
jgi:hypothetical protein